MLLSLAILLVGLILLSTLGQPESTFVWWICRLTTLGLLLSLLALKRGSAAFPLDPPLLVAAAVFILYVLGPAIIVSVLLDGPVPLDPADTPDIVRQPGWNITFEASRRAVESTGTWLTLRFTLICLLASTLLSLTIKIAPGKSALDFPWKGPAILGLIASLLQLGRRWDLYSSLPADVTTRFLDFLPVVASTCLAMLVFACRNRRQSAPRWAFAILMVLAVVAFMPFGTKILGWALIIDVLILGLSFSGKARRVLLAAIIFLPFLFATILTVSRGDGYQFNKLYTASLYFQHKMIYRQAETIYCLTFVDKENSNKEFSITGIGHLSAGLVPKFIWNDKPSLSRGNIYAESYCGWPHQEVVFSRHSASITLLGEPLLLSGPWGLAVAQAWVVGFLMLAGYALNSGRPIWMTTALAILPWMVDFDQNFIMWLANIGKFIGPAAILAWLSWRIGRRNS